MLPAATKIPVEEFLENPDIHYYDFNELHNGEVVVVSPPTDEHIDLQQRIETLLMTAFEGAGYGIFREYYYTVAYNGRRADVAVVLASRRVKGKTFRGGPDLVIEILSRSNSALDLDQLRVECFNEGCREFWVVNPQLQLVTVYHQRSNQVSLYDRKNDMIPLDEFVRGAGIPVSGIFA